MIYFSQTSCSISNLVFISGFRRSGCTARRRRCRRRWEQTRTRTAAAASEAAPCAVRRDDPCCRRTKTSASARYLVTALSKQVCLVSVTSVVLSRSSCSALSSTSKSDATLPTLTSAPAGSGCVAALRAVLPSQVFHESATDFSFVFSFLFLQQKTAKYLGGGSG